MNRSPPGAAWRATVLSALALALALMGDQLLYVVLPLEAEAFGMSLFWVGILLSANRWIRVLAYGEIARLGHRLGAKRLTVLAAIGATVSTTLYAFGEGEFVLLSARVLWGVSFAGFNLTVLVYALGDGQDAGKRIGVSRALRQVGPAIAAGGGAWLALQMGPREVFYLLGALTALAIPLAFALPRDELQQQAAAPRGFAVPHAYDLFSFAGGFAVEGVFVVSVGLLFAQEASASGALLGAGVVIGARHVVMIAISPIGGLLADRYGVDRILLYATLLVVAGFAAVPIGETALAVILILIGRAMQAVAGPIIVTRRNPANPMQAISTNATWGDLGAALGPTMAGIVIGLISLDVIYSAMAGMVALLYVNFLWRASQRRHHGQDR